MQSPEPAYRQSLRETNAKMEAVAQRMQHLHLLLGDRAVEGAIGTDWQPLEGVNGCETRLVSGAFVMEARYEAGAEHGDVTVEQAVYGQVSEGRFHLRRHGLDKEPITYEVGQLFYLAPHERHAWRAEGPTKNVIVFVPATT